MKDILELQRLKTQNPKEYYRSRYIEEPNTGCWIWIYSLDRDGYAKADHGGSKIYAHRLLYILYKGIIPLGYEIDHLCKLRCCVNPDHLEAVTKEENFRRVGTVKLTKAIADEIRAKAQFGSRALANEYGISQSNICNILANRIWC